MAGAPTLLQRLLLRMGAWLFWPRRGAFVLGRTASLNGGGNVAGLLPGVAILAGALAFVAWLVLFLVGNDAVTAKQRRRRR